MNNGAAVAAVAAAAAVAAGVAGAAAAPISCIEAAFLHPVENSLRTYESPLNDTAREAAMKSVRAQVITLTCLVDSPDEERRVGEFMVCIILAITNAGVWHQP